MPQIKEYGNRVGVAGPQQQARASAGNTGNMLAQAGQQIAQAGNQVQDFHDRKDQYEAQKTYIAAQSQWIDKFNEMKQNISFNENEPEFTQKVNEEFDRFHSTLLEGKSGKGAEYLESQMSRLKLDLHNDAVQYQAVARGKHEREQLSVVFDQNSNRVRQDPSVMGKILQSEMEFVETNPYLPPEVKKEIANKRRQELWDKSLDGTVTALETNPKITIREVNGMIAQMSSETAGYKTNANPGEYDRNLTRLQKLKETLGEKHERQYISGFSETMQQMRKHGTETEGYQKNKYSEAEIRSMVRDPALQERMIDEQRGARAVAVQMTAMRDMPAEQVPAYLKSLEEKAKSSNDYSTDGDALAAAHHAFEVRMKALKEDPAGYASSVNTQVKNLQELAETDPTPENVAAYVEATITVQKRLNPGALPAILPQNRIGEIKAKLSAIGNSEQSATEGLSVIQAEVQRYGKYSPIAMRDLRAAGALNDAQFVAAQMVGRPEMKFMAEDLLRAGAQKPEDMKLPEGAKKNVIRQVDRSLAPLRATVSDQTYRAYANALEQLGLYQSAKTGNDASGSIDDMAKKMILDSYEFKDTYRIPKTVSAPAVERAASTTMRELDALPIVPPGSTIPLQKGDIRDRYLSNLKANAAWVNEGDDSGIRLVDEHGRTVMVERNGKVVPLSMSWSEAEAKSFNATKKKNMPYPGIVIPGP
jgi:hypothetical protein